MLDLDPGMIIWTWVTFIIVLGILYKVALKPILNAIDSRENSIRSDLEEAQKQRDEAQELLEEHKQMVDKAEAEAQKLFKESQALADKARQETLDKAREESDKLLDKAKAEIEKEKDSALTSLKEEVADLAIGAAEKILSANLDESKQKAVVDEYIKSMPKSLKN